MRGTLTKSDVRPDVSSALDRGVAFLASRQLQSGQFPAEATIHPQQIATLDQSVFATTYIVYSLDFVLGRLARGMIARGIEYFKAEMTGRDLWRYWNKNAEWGGRKITACIPADLDDTASVLYLLRHHGIPFPENRPLIVLNRNGAGLFYTWLMLRPARTTSPRYWWIVLRELTVQRLTLFWKTTEAGYLDVDGKVNANVLLYLGECPETAAVVEWLIEIVRTGCEATCDKCYRDAFSLYLRAFAQLIGPVFAPSEWSARRSLQGCAAARYGTGQICAPLQTALGVNTLLNLGAGTDAALIDRALDYLLDTQSTGWNWPSAPYYYGGPLKAVSWGSPELITGLCLEALARNAVGERGPFPCAA